MKDSEFIAKSHLSLHYNKDGPCPNIEGSKEVNIKKGGKIPEIFIQNFIRNNRDLIANLPMKDGIPQLTKEQEKKYGLSFVKAKPKNFTEEVEKLYPKYDMENLKEKVANYIKKNGAKIGKEKFKDWAEKEFGEEKIDKRKSQDGIIVQILDLQDKENK